MKVYLSVEGSHTEAQLTFGHMNECMALPEISTGIIVLNGAHFITTSKAEFFAQALKHVP